MRSLVPVSRLRGLDSISELTRQMERFFDELNGSWWSGALAFPGEEWIPPMDVVETDEEVRCTVEVPGVSREDLEVAVQDGVLRIAGTKKAERTEEDGTSYRRFERRYGRFERYLRLPERIDADRITASYDDGVLTLVLPKSESARPRQIPIATSVETK